MRLSAKPCHTFPTEIKLHQLSKLLEISFADGHTFTLPYEYLRVYSQSAEAVGHGPGQDVLQVGKESVQIVDIRPIGNYGIAPTFSDGHDSGIYSWDLLYHLGLDYPTLWDTYLSRLQAAGYNHTSPSQN
jgi:DUF971 family protein